MKKLCIVKFKILMLKLKTVFIRNSYKIVLLYLKDFKIEIKTWQTH